MSYQTPVGYLGDGGNETALRQSIERQAQELWAESQRLAQEASAITRADSFSDRALDAALEVAQRAARAAGSEVRLDRAQYVASIQASVAQVAGMAVTLKRLSMSRDALRAHQRAQGLYGAAFRLAAATRQMASAARGGVSMSGLGLIHMVAGPVIIIAVSLYLAWRAGLNDAEQQQRHALEAMERSGARSPQERMDVYRQALEAQSGPSVAGLLERVVEEGGTTARSWNDRVSDMFEKPLMIVAGVGVVAVVGAGLFAAWPYLMGVRNVGEQLSGQD